jgi:hypothetical protein
MKAYQEQWLERLQSATRAEQVLAVCQKIVNDDTGHTDALTQALAKAFLQHSNPVIGKQVKKFYDRYGWIRSS